MSRQNDALKLLKYKRNKTTHKNKKTCRSHHPASAISEGPKSEHVEISSSCPISATVRTHQKRTG